MRNSITSTGETIEVRDATQVTLLIALATSYVNFADVSGDPVASGRRDTETAARKPYAALKAAHVAAHRALFRRLSLRLDSAAAPSRPTKERILTAEVAPDPALAALYVQYGRYLLMSCSRAGSQPANLQGLWNEGTNPPWGSKYTININTQMNYWPAGSANLGDCVEPLVRTYRRAWPVTGMTRGLGWAGAGPASSPCLAPVRGLPERTDQRSRHATADRGGQDHPQYPRRQAAAAHCRSIMTRAMHNFKGFVTVWGSDTLSYRSALNKGNWTR